MLLLFDYGGAVVATLLHCFSFVLSNNFFKNNVKRNFYYTNES